MVFASNGFGYVGYVVGKFEIATGKKRTVEPDDSQFPCVEKVITYHRCYSNLALYTQRVHPASHGINLGDS